MLSVSDLRRGPPRRLPSDFRRARLTRYMASWSAPSKITAFERHDGQVRPPRAARLTGLHPRLSAPAPDGGGNMSRRASRPLAALLFGLALVVRVASASAEPPWKVLPP